MSIREFQPIRAVEVIVTRDKSKNSDSKNSYGSGYRIGGRLVLTAAHLLDAVGSYCNIRHKKSFGEKKAKVVWKAKEGLDIALIELPEKIENVEPITLGQLPEGKAGENIWFQMYGYPGWGLIEGNQKSATSGLQVKGMIYLADTPPLVLRIDENLVSEYLANMVISEIKNDSRELKSEWRGMSGAAVVCDGLIVAVQKQHPRPMQPNYVAATPLWTIHDDKQWCDLLKKHGINPKPEIARLESLSSKSLWRELCDNFLKRFSSEAIFSKYCEDILDKVENQWIKPTLDNPFYNQVQIQLSLEQRLDLVELISSEQPEQLKKVLPKGTKPISIFNDLGRAKSLLILGEPGSGKTIALLELTQSLVKESKRASTLSVPIFLNLSSWTDTYQSLDFWLAHQIDDKYNIRNKKFIKALIQKLETIFVLDGLDEVRQEFQTSCIQAINKFRSDHVQVSIVVGSRLQDYEQHSLYLKFRCAVCIQALNPEEVSQYLRLKIDALKAEDKKVSDDSDLKGKIEQLVVVKELIYKDRNLQQIVDTPLMLSIIYAVTGSQSSISSILEQGSPEERRQKLFDAYIERVLNRRKSDQEILEEQQYKKDDIKRWLSWISHYMTHQSNNFESQTEFRIEQLQPSCLETDIQQKTRYRFLVFLMLFSRGFYYSLFIGFWSQFLTVRFFFNSSGNINLSNTESIITGIVTIFFGISASLVIGIFAAYFDEIKTFKSLSWSLNTIILRVQTLLKPIVEPSKPEKDIPEIPTFEDKLFTSLLMLSSVILVFSFKGIYYTFLYLAYMHPQILGHENPANNLILKSHELMNAVGADTSEGSTLLLTAIVAFWFFLGLLGLGRDEGTKEVSPGQGIVESRKVSKVILLLSIMIFQPIYFYILLGVIHTQPQFFSIQSGFVAVISILAVFWCGGFTEIQHFALRRVLSRCNFIPFDLESFLDQSSRVLLLKRFGGSYTFFHPLLQNHFLESSIDSTEPDAST